MKPKFINITFNSSMENLKIFKFIIINYETKMISSFMRSDTLKSLNVLLLIMKPKFINVTFNSSMEKLIASFMIDH